MKSELDSLVQKVRNTTKTPENQESAAQKSNKAHGHYRGLEAVFNKLEQSEKNSVSSIDTSDASDNVHRRSVKSVWEKLDF